MTFIVCFISVGNAHATFQDGKATKDKQLVFNVSVQAGDTIEIDYKTTNTFATSIMTLKDLQGNTIVSHKSTTTKQQTFTYTFQREFDGVLILQGGDQSIGNLIYEVRINGFTYFDGTGFIYGEVAIDNKFLKIQDVKINKARLTYDHSYIPPGFVIRDIVLTFRETVMNGNKEFVDFANLKADTTYQLTAQIYFTNGHISNLLSVKFQTPEIVTEGIMTVSDIGWDKAKLVINRNAISSQSTFEKINIYKGAEKIDEIGSGTGNATYQLTGLEPETAYSYSAEIVFDSSNTSRRIPVTFTTLVAKKEVSELKAQATSESVNLTWKMPEYEELNFARIYRKSSTSGMMRMFSLFSSSDDGYTPLFETNGTSFKDLTVSPDTSYTYKVTTVSTDNAETNGVTVNTKTGKSEVIGGGLEVGENGDYVVKWTSPTKGKLKVIVGGKQYVVVPASDGQVTIPRKDMILDPLGRPDVTLIPIAENGSEGVPSMPGGSVGGGGLGSLPGGIEIGEILNGENLLQSGVALLAIVGAFLLLGLAFRVVPKLIYTIKNAFQQPSNNGGRER